MVHENDRRGEHENDTLFERQGSCIQAEIENVDLILAFIDILREEIGHIDDKDLPLLLKKRFGIGLTFDQVDEILHGKIIIEEFDTRDVYF